MPELATILFIELATATGSVVVAGIVTAITIVAVNLAIASVLGKILAPAFEKNGRAGKGIQLNTKSNIAPRKTIYGEAVVGGPFLFMESYGFTEVEGVSIPNARLNFIIGLAGHPVEDILGVFMGDEYINIADGANDLNASYTVVNGPYGDINASILGIPIDFPIAKIIKVKGWAYADKQYVTNEVANTDVTDDQTRAAAINNETEATWDVSGLTRDSQTGLWEAAGDRDKLTNCAYIFMSLFWTKDILTALPQIRFHVKGKRVYNPYLDPSSIMQTFGSSPSGTHDINDPDTWEWSDDWSLCCLDYLTNEEYGLKANKDPTDPLCEIDWEEAINSYNVSSEVITNGFLNSPYTGTGPRYTINGAFEVDATPISLMETLLNSGAGQLVYAQGKYKLRPGIYRAPANASDIINEDMIVSPLVITTHVSRSQIFNKVAGIFMDKGYTGTPSTTNPPAFEPEDFPVVNPVDSSGNNPYQVEDGSEIIREFDFPFTTSSHEAQRLGRIQLERVRRGFTVQFEGTMELLKYSVGDTVYLEILSNSKYANEAFFNHLGLDDQVQNDPVSPKDPYYKQFKIVEMAYTENFTISVTMIEEAEEIYDWNDGYAVEPTAALISEITVDDWRAAIIPPIWVVSSGFSVVTELTSGTDIVTELRWGAPDRGSAVTGLDSAHVSSYEVQYGIVTDSINSVQADRVGTWLSAGVYPQEELNGATQGVAVLHNLYVNDTTNYDFRVRSILRTGRRSDWAYYSIDVGSDYSPGLPYGAKRYYMALPDGTTIKEGVGTLNVEAKELTAAGVVDVASPSTIKIYEATSPYTDYGYSAAFSTSNINEKLSLVLSDGTPPNGKVLDAVTLVDIYDGVQGPDPVTINYTNSAHAVPVDNLGNETWTGSGGLLRVWEGNTALTLKSNTQTSGHTGLANGEYYVDITAVSGDTLTEPGISGAATTFATLGEWAGDLTTLSVYRLNVYIQDSVGTQHTLVLDISLSPALEGADGVNGDPGAPGQAVRTVNIYKLNDPTVGAPTAGTFADPLNGQEAGWSLTVPDLTADNDTIYVSTRTFTDDASSPQDPSWSTPTIYSRRIDGKVGWGHDMIFSVTSPTETDIAWTTGTLKLVDGTTFDIPANTLSMTIGSRYYIYFDADLGSPYELQNTTTMTTAVGNNKILLAVAEAYSDRSEAYFQVFGGAGGIKLAADEIAANSITANNIAASFYQGRSFTGGTFQTRIPNTSSPYPGTTRVVIQEEGTNIGIFANDGASADVEIFGVTDVGGTTVVNITGDIQAEIDSQIFSATGITNLRDALGVVITGTPTGGIASRATVPFGIGSGAPQDWELDSGIYETGLNTNTLTFTIKDSGYYMESTNQGWTSPTWDVNIYYSTGSPHTWNQVPGADWTITGTATNGFDFEARIWEGWLNLNSTKTLDWTPPSPFTSGDTIYYMIRTDWVSGTVIQPKITQLSASEPVIGNSVAVLNDLTDVTISGGVSGQLLELQSDGTWINVTPSGGAVTGSGSNNQIAVWSGATSLDGSSNLTFDGTNFVFSSVNFGDFFIDRQSATGGAAIAYQNDDGLKGYAGFNDLAQFEVYTAAAGSSGFTVDASGNIASNSITTSGITVGTTIERDSTTDSLAIFGGNASTGARVRLYSGSHATLANNAYYDADFHVFRDVDAAPNMATFSPTQITLVQNVDCSAGLDITGLTTATGNIRLDNSVYFQGETTTAVAVDIMGINSSNWFEIGDPGYNAQYDAAFHKFSTNMELASGADLAFKDATNASTMTGTMSSTTTFLLSGAGSTNTIESSIAHLKLSVAPAIEPVTPTISFGDGDSGFFEYSDDVIGISLVAATEYLITAASFRASGTLTPAMVNEESTATNPVWSFVSDLDTGIGHVTGVADQLSLIAGGIELMRLTEGTNTYIHMDYPLLMKERASAVADVSTYGQFWAQNSTALDPWFTNEAGLDYPLGFATYRKVTNSTTLDNLNVTGETIGASYMNGAWIKTDTSADSLTLETSASTNFEVGAQLTIINAGSSGNMTINDTASQTLYVLTGSAVTDVAGSCTIAPGGYATLIRITPATSYIMGAGVTA